MSNFEFPKPSLTTFVEDSPQKPGEFERQNRLIEVAKAKYEGLILSAPLARELKEKITTALDALVLTNPSPLFADLHQGPMDEEHDALRASLWVDREMRGCVDMVARDLDEKDAYILKEAVSQLTLPESARTRKVVITEKGWELVWK